MGVLAASTSIRADVDVADAMTYAGDDGGQGPSRADRFSTSPISTLFRLIQARPILSSKRPTRPCLRIAVPAKPMLAPRAFGSSIGSWLRTIRKSLTSGAVSMRSRRIWRNLTAPISGLPCSSSPLWPLRSSTAVSVARSTTANTAWSSHSTRPGQAAASLHRSSER